MFFKSRVKNSLSTILKFPQFHESLLNRVLGVLACSRARVLCVFTCLRAYVLSVLACLRAWHACVLACLACLRAYVLGMPACLRAWRARVLACFCTHVLNLRVCYDACLACSALAYSRFCLIIVFVCINQSFTIKGKLLIRVNLS